MSSRLGAQKGKEDDGLFRFVVVPRPGHTLIMATNRDHRASHLSFYLDFLWKNLGLIGGGPSCYAGPEAHRTAHHCSALFFCRRRMGLGTLGA